MLFSSLFICDGKLGVDHTICESKCFKIFKLAALVNPPIVRNYIHVWVCRTLMTLIYSMQKIWT